jgi:hypothetical protein
MNEQSPLPHLSHRQTNRCRKLHAAVSVLPVYQFERLAFTDAANVPPVNAATGTDIPRSLLENFRCFLCKQFRAWSRFVP